LSGGEQTSGTFLPVKIFVVTPTHTSIPIATRLSRFSYAIRNIVTEAQRVEAAGITVRYLNVGNPPAFGFQPPPELIEAVRRAMQNGENGYGPSAGIAPARAAVAQEYSARGWPVSPDRVLITAGTSEGIDLVLTALVDPGGEVLVPMPTYPLYTAILAKLGARAVYYRTDAAQGWSPDLDHLNRVVTSVTRAIVVIDPNNPTGATYPAAVRRELIAFADRYGLAILADEVYGDIAYTGPHPPIGSLEPDAPIISCSSLSKGFVAPGWRTGWLALGRSPRLDDVLTALKRLADGRLCSTVPMQHAVAPALTGDRSHQALFRKALQARAKVTTEMLGAIPGITCTPPTAAFYAMPKVSLPPGRTDEHFVLELLRATGLLCVYGSGFGAPPGDGYFRIVFLASPEELREVYRILGAFTADYLARS
jgi:alanine-synthesizing transaminase